MRKVKEDWSTRSITTPDGITISFFNNKLHNWNGPAIKYKDGSKRKAEYYLYGIQLEKSQGCFLYILMFPIILYRIAACNIFRNPLK